MKSKSSKKPIVSFFLSYIDSGEYTVVVSRKSKRMKKAKERRYALHSRSFVFNKLTNLTYNPNVDVSVHLTVYPTIGIYFHGAIK